MRIVDQGRSSYYKWHTGQTWGKRGNYHLCLDSGTLGVDGCGEAIITAYKQGDSLKGGEKL